jgi:hypothetical protein
VPLHDLKIGVWCAISARKTIQPVSFTKQPIPNVMWDRFCHPSSINWLIKRNCTGIYAKQCTHNTHIANNSVVALDEIFGERIISWGMWPPRSPDLNPCDFYLWGTLKEKVYINNPHSLEELQANIRHEISAVPIQQLRRVSVNIFSLWDACLEAEGLYFKILL